MFNVIDRIYIYTILFAFGSLLYFSLAFETNILIPIICFCMGAIARFFLSEKRNILNLFLFFIFGFLVASSKTILLDSKPLQHPIKFTIAEGRIAQLTTLTTGTRILLDNVKLENGPKVQKIRVTFRTATNNAEVGDIVRFKCSLLPAPSSNIPGGYNFARIAYFEQISAVGYSLSPLEIIEKTQNSASQMLQNFRNKFVSRVIEILGPKQGYIATAFMVGEYNAIDKQILDSMRVSGLAHILSVSGLHLSLASLIFFVTARFLLNLNSNFALNYNTKKIAAIFAIIGSLAYLLISGSQIAAVRAFIMCFFVLSAALIDRPAEPMRSIAVAAFFIILVSPEAVINPSFQMSFFAVIALIGSFGFYSELTKKIGHNIFGRICSYILSTIFFSFVASIATSPFIIYHFNNFSSYSVLANLLASPITSFWIMPLVVISFLLYPTSLFDYTVKLMGVGIQLVIDISEYTANLSNAKFMISHLPDISIFMISVAMLIFFLCSGRIKIVSVGLLVLALTIFKFKTMPDIVIDSKSMNYAIYNNQLFISSKKINKNTKNLWLNYFGMEGFSEKDPRSCNENNICYYHKNDNYIGFIKQLGTLSSARCQDALFFIDQHSSCSDNSIVLTPEFIEKNGSIFVYMEKKPYIVTTRQKAGMRPWN